MKGIVNSVLTKSELIVNRILIVSMLDFAPFVVRR